MDSSILSYLLIALVALGIIAVIVLIRTLSRVGETAEALTGAVGALAETARSATATSDEARAAVADIRERAIPTMLKVDVAVDAVNANLLRLDSIMGDIESTTEQVANASSAVSNLASAPVDVVTNLAERFRKAWRVRRAEVAEDVQRYTDNLSHAAQQAAHVEYAPAGTGATSSSAPTVVEVAAAVVADPEPAQAVVEPVQVAVESSQFEFVPDYTQSAESDDLPQRADVVATQYEEPADADADDSDADFSSEDISRFSAAAVLSRDAGDEGVQG